VIHQGQPPANADVTYGVSVYDVSCGAAIDCSAVGTYGDSSLNQWSFVVDEVDASGRGPARSFFRERGQEFSGFGLHSISCASRVLQRRGRLQCRRRREPRPGTFRGERSRQDTDQCTEITLPVGANFNPFGELSQVSCSRAGDCSAAARTSIRTT